MHHNLGRYGGEHRLPVIAAHIHTGAAGVIGAPLIDFSAMLTGGPLVVPSADLAVVIADPSAFYYNVHTDPSRAAQSAVSWNSSAASRSRAALGLLLLGLIGVAWLRRRS